MPYLIVVLREALIVAYPKILLRLSALPMPLIGLVRIHPILAVIPHSTGEAHESFALPMIFDR